MSNTEQVEVPLDEVKEKEVVVTLADDGAKIDDKPETPPETPKVEEDEREKALTDLRGQLEREKQAREQERQDRDRLEQFARDQSARVQTAQVEIQDSQLRTIVNAIDATEQSAQAAERAYADALAAGDYAAAAQAQRAMARAETHLVQLNSGKRALESRLDERRVEGAVRDEAQEPPRRQAPRDPLEEMAASLTPKSAEWLRSHPEMVSKVSKLTAAHQSAVELEGIEVESPEYFAYIEQKLGIGEKKEAKPVPKASKPSMTAMPTSSGGISSSGSSPTSMRLSPEEVELAIMNEPSLPRDKALEVWARNKADLIKSGKLR